MSEWLSDRGNSQNSHAAPPAELDQGLPEALEVDDADAGLVYGAETGLCHDLAHSERLGGSDEGLLLHSVRGGLELLENALELRVGGWGELGLLLLPAELRKHVFELLVVQPGPVGRVDLGKRGLSDELVQARVARALEEPVERNGPVRRDFAEFRLISLLVRNEALSEPPAHLFDEILELVQIQAPPVRLGLVERLLEPLGGLLLALGSSKSLLNANNARTRVNIEDTPNGLDSIHPVERLRIVQQQTSPSRGALALCQPGVLRVDLCTFACVLAVRNQGGDVHVRGKQRTVLEEEMERGRIRVFRRPGPAPA